METTKRKTEASATSQNEHPEKKKKAKAIKEPVTVVSPIQRYALDEGGGHDNFKIISWNCAGLRAPGRAQDLKHIAEQAPDLICIQETKLQDDWAEYQSVLPGYKAFFSHSTGKKGYAGTAVFTKKKDEGGGSNSQCICLSVSLKVAYLGKGTISNFFKRTNEAAPASSSAAASHEHDVVSVSFGIDDKDHDGEGRSITLMYQDFFVVALYVPNSGQKVAPF